MWVKNNHGSKKNCVKKSVVPKRILSTKCWYLKMLGPKKKLMPKNVGSKQIICPTISLMSNYFSLKQNVAQKVLVPKIEGARNCVF